jgi:hypothetical protein
MTFPSDLELVEESPRNDLPRALAVFGKHAGQNLLRIPLCDLYDYLMDLEREARTIRNIFRTATTRKFGGVE